VNQSIKSQLLFNKIKISTHIPLYHILANITNSHGIDKMTYVAKYAFIFANNDEYTAEKSSRPRGKITM
jgi:hypothetical protein